ncbi:MAG: class I SAM-dependent methyltransferase [Candidatus Aminicenantes bacterium]|nr:class I SAM-dependent methyltransferase [Candidatus Aminicenantes bacterium]
MEWIKFIIRKLGYNRLKNKLYKNFINEILYPFALLARISLSEGIFLMELVKESHKFSGPIVEIGTLFGYSTTIMIHSKDPQRKLISVDDFSWNPCGFSKNLHYDLTKKLLEEATEKHSVQLLNMDKNEFYRTYNDVPPSLVFFDANHTYEETMRDLLWAKEVGVKVISGHDYKKETPGVIQAVNEVCEGKPSRIHESIYVL